MPQNEVVGPHGLPGKPPAVLRQSGSWRGKGAGCHFSQALTPPCGGHTMTNPSLTKESPGQGCPNLLGGSPLGSKMLLRPSHAPFKRRAPVLPQDLGQAWALRTCSRSPPLLAGYTLSPDAKCPQILFHRKAVNLGTPWPVPADREVLLPEVLAPSWEAKPRAYGRCSSSSTSPDS